MFTTRERAPRRDDALSPSRGVDASNVTTLAALRRASSSRTPSSPARRSCGRSPNSTTRGSEARSRSSRTAAATPRAYRVEQIRARRVQRGEPERQARRARRMRRRVFSGRAPTLSAASRACRRSATSASARLAAKPASRTNLNAPAHRVSNASESARGGRAPRSRACFRGGARARACCSTGHAKLTAPEIRDAPEDDEGVRQDMREFVHASRERVETHRADEIERHCAARRTRQARASARRARCTLLR